MSSKELRLGNLVSGLLDTPVKLSPTQLLNFSAGMESIKPIPLTEDLLLKFGFKKAFDDFEISIGNGKIAYSELEFHTSKGFVNKHIIMICLRDFATLEMNLEHIKYAHQLQNLYFALTGEELKIEKL